MSQQPPGPPQPPPPAAPPPPGPMQPASTGGMDKKTGGLIAYVLGWVTGLIMLFVGKDDPDIRYNAAQSIVFFGGLSVLLIIIGILGGIFTALLGFLGILFTLLYWVVWIFGFVSWIMLLVRVNGSGGARVQVPLVGNLVSGYAEQIAGSVK